MALNNYCYLSYILDEKTPTYGNRSRFQCQNTYAIKQGHTANDSTIQTTVHIGTHLDMPLHFFDEGQSIEAYNIDFFRFKHILFIEITPQTWIIKNDLIAILEQIDMKETYEILIVKTGICLQRGTQTFWEQNYGFHPCIAEYLRAQFPSIRVLGFDSISVSSLTDRLLGREAHKAFLNPQRPILLLEDMDLTQCNAQTIFATLIIAPLRIAQRDGLPCTVIAEIR